jgi:LGFP repeat
VKRTNFLSSLAFNTSEPVAGKGFCRIAAALIVMTVQLVSQPGTALAQRVYGKIGEKYSALKGPQGPLGLATSDEAAAPYGGRFNSFKNGFIYWHPDINTAYGVWGAIGAKWNALGRVQFGYPITDESTTPDGRGRYNHFRAMHLAGRPESSIYWTPQTGAFAVYGEIRKAWAAAGWERSIGYPTSDEFQWGKYRRSNFERGYITWTAGEAARVFRSGDAILRQNQPGTFGSIMVTGIELALDNKPYEWNDTILSENTVCPELDAKRAQIEELMKNTIRAGAAPRMGRFGIRSDARMELSSACSFRADVATMGSHSIRLRTYLPANSFSFHVTPPTVFGSWSDPAFSVTFDIWAETFVAVPSSSAGNLSAGASHVVISAARLDSHNVTGDIALAIAEAYKLITGTDVAAKLTETRAIDSPVLQTGLPALTTAVKRIPGLYRIETTVAPGDLLRVNGTGLPQAPAPSVH